MIECEFLKQRCERFLWITEVFVFNCVFINIVFFLIPESSTAFTQSLNEVDLSPGQGQGRFLNQLLFFHRNESR